jgi:hypothetical protein
MVVYLSKPMIMRIMHMWGYQGWEDLEWWTCARAKENYDYEAPMTSSLSDYTWLEKEWKFRLSTTWHPSLYFIFLIFYLIHPSHIFIATPLFSFSSLFSFSHSHIFYLSLLFYYIFFLSFFLFHTHTFLFIFPSLDNFSKLSTPLFLACIQSENLNKPC